MSERVYICGQCHEGTIISITDQRFLDGTARGHTECDHCEARYGIWWDGGTVDLDELRYEQMLNPSNDFIIEP